ncbi:hypothetical protein [Aestuariivirga litoralis]|nr:hypothetical protein [Aestuariivirga litoralis]
MSNIDNTMNQNQPSSGFEGMAEQHPGLGGSPGGVRGMASKAGEKIMDTAERQKAVGADYVDSIAGAVRRAAGEFEGQVPQAADYIRYAADQIETMSDSLRRRDIGQMMQDVQSFARRQPTAFLGLSFLAGFAAIRFLKSGASGAGTSSAGGESWRAQEPVDSGRYGATAGAGMGEDRFGASQSPGMTPGVGL